MGFTFVLVNFEYSGLPSIMCMLEGGMGFFQSVEGLNRTRPASLSRRKFSSRLPQT